MVPGVVHVYMGIGVVQGYMRPGVAQDTGVRE
jgi:hypothetical protein